MAAAVEPTVILRASVRFDAGSRPPGLLVPARQLPAAPDRLQVRLLRDEQVIINFDAILAAAVPRLELSSAAKLFGDATAYEAAPLAEAAAERLVRDGSAVLVTPLSGAPGEWDLDAWPMTPVLERWGARGRTPVVLVDVKKLAVADPVTRRQFVLWAQRARVTVRAIESGPPPWLAAVTSQSGATAWASAADAASDIGPGWAAASEAPVVFGPISAPVFGPEVDFAPLLATGGREALLEIGSELDGPATGFGARFKALLAGRSPELDRVLSAPFLSITYADRYLFSPLTVRLISELVAGLADENTAVRIRTLAGRPDGRARGGKLIQSDWTDLSMRALVLGQFLAESAPRSVVDLKTRLGHRRRLDFVTERGAGTIFFDQGIGSWLASGRVEFDHLASADAQIKTLGKPFAVMNGPEGTFVAVRLTE